MWVKCKESKSLGVQAQKSHLLRLWDREPLSLLSVLGEPGHQELRQLVMQTHTGKVGTKNEGQLVLKCLVWCLAY